MADTSGMADIRGLQIDKVAKGYADESLIMKQFLVGKTATAREIRWYTKTSGFLESTDTTGITADQIQSVHLAAPTVIEQSWTRNTSNVKTWIVESPMMSMQDLKDNDVDLLMTITRDLVRAVGYQVDKRIISVLTEAYTPANIQTAAAVADGWDDTATGNPVLDVMNARQKIRSYGYDPKSAVLLINSIEEKNLINYLISVKGSSIPNVSSDKVITAALTEFMGCRVVVSELFTTDFALVFVPNSGEWHSFRGMQAALIEEQGIGRKVRVWEDGEAVLTDPKAVFLITDTAI